MQQGTNIWKWGCLGLIGIVALVVIFIGVIFTAAIVTTPPSPEDQVRNSDQGGKAAQGSNDQAAPEIPQYEMGEAIPTDDGELTIISAEQADGINLSYDKPIEGNFVVIEYEYTSNRSEGIDAQFAGETPFVLEDQDGNVYEEHFDATSALSIDEEKDMPGGMDKINPGVPASGLSVFEVGPEASEFKLGVSDPISADDNLDGVVPLELGTAVTEDATPVAATDASASASASASAAPASGDQAVIDDANAYYAAAAAGDYTYTYDNLASGDQADFTEQEWFDANTALGSDQATYIVTAARDIGGGQYEVDVTVSGAPRTTYFVDEGGGFYVHALTMDEWTMMDQAA